MVQLCLSGGANVPCHDGTLAPHAEHEWTVLPSAHPSPQPKRQINQFSRFFPAHARKSIIPILYNGYPFLPKLPLPTGIWTPFNLWFLGPVQAHNPNSITKCLYNLQWAAPYPSKLLIPMGDQDPPSNTWFPGNTRVLNSNGISSGSSVFAGSLVWQTDRQTHKQTERQTDRPIDHSPWSVTTVRI